MHRTHKDHTVHCLLQAAQMAAEGPPPPGVSRSSLDSAFGGAHRALQLSALSMPERIAYMQVRASGSRVQQYQTTCTAAVGAVHACVHRLHAV